jgi:hypothetical protein
MEVSRRSPHTPVDEDRYSDGGDEDMDDSSLVDIEAAGLRRNGYKGRLKSPLERWLIVGRIFLAVSAAVFFLVLAVILVTVQPHVASMAENADKTMAEVTTDIRAASASAREALSNVEGQNMESAAKTVNAMLHTVGEMDTEGIDAGTHKVGAFLKEGTDALSDIHPRDVVESGKEMMKGFKHDGLSMNFKIPLLDP